MASLDKGTDASPQTQRFLTSPPPQSRSAPAARALVPADEAALLGAAHDRTAKQVYAHVKQQCAKLQEAHYLPKAATERSVYDQWCYLRRKSREFKLSSTDYQLLAHLPHILGPAVFGHVEAREGGWR